MCKSRQFLAWSCAMLMGGALGLQGCSRSDPEFEMTVAQVDLLQGMIMRGISLTGEIRRGCIANDETFTVMRGGEQVLTERVRVVNVAHLNSSESFTGRVNQGETVTFFIPDGKLGDVKVGDVVVAEDPTCEPPKEMP